MELCVETMRITLTIDDDVLAAAKKIAAEEHKALGAVISGLARHAMVLHPSSRAMRNGIPLLPARPYQPRITPQLILRLQDSLL